MGGMEARNGFLMNLSERVAEATPYASILAYESIHRLKTQVVSKTTENHRESTLSGL